MLTVFVPIKTGTGLNSREHHMARSRRVKAERAAVGWLLQSKTHPALPCTVTLTRIAPRSLDGDNLQGSLKAPRDAVAVWLKVDDADPRVTWLYDQRKGKPKEYAVEVAIA